MPWIAAIWTGTTDEAIRFAEAIQHHCQRNELQRRCPAHDMMTSQRVIDYLLFLRWLYLQSARGRI